MSQEKIIVTENEAGDCHNTKIDYTAVRVENSKKTAMAFGDDLLEAKVRVTGREECDPITQSGGSMFLPPPRPPVALGPEFPDEPERKPDWLIALMKRCSIKDPRA